MKRRHQIVHEADLRLGQNGYELQDVNIEDINTWQKTIGEFFTELARLITEDIYVPKIVKRLNESGFPVNKEDIGIDISVSS